MRFGTIVLACLLVAVAAAACASLPAWSSALPLRVMTYNIQYGGAGLDRIAETIRAAAPDLVALQEVDVHWSARSSFVDQATGLGERLGMQVRFARIYQYPGEAAAPAREFGVAVLSRYPIVAFQNHPISRLSTQGAESAPALLPGFLEASIDVRGTRLRVFNTHLDYRPDPAVRQRQVAEMLAIIGEPSSPTLLFGDMNAGPAAPELQPLFARLHDSWTATADAGLTFPSSAPVKRIDYVLASSAIRVRSARVPDTQSSDHRPVIVDLVVPRVRK